MLQPETTHTSNPIAKFDFPDVPSDGKYEVVMDEGKISIFPLEPNFIFQYVPTRIYN